MSRLLRLAPLLAALAWAAAVHAQTAPVPVGQDETGAPVTCVVEPADASVSRRAPSLGEVDVLIVRVRFAGDAQAPPQTDAAGIEAWYARNSYGLLDLRVTQAPVIQLTEARDHYAALGDTHVEGAWVDEVAARLAETGTPPGDFDIVATLARAGAPFDLGGATGLARLWGRDVWATSGSELVMVHEIGHTLGLNHARRRNVLNGNPLAGELREYGNPHDAMGNVAAGSFSAASKSWLGWIDALPDLGTALNVAGDASGTATVRIRPTDVAASPGAAGGVRIELPEEFCLPPLRAELRAELGGVLVQEWRPVTGVLVQTTLIDATPGALPSDGDYALMTSGEPLVLGQAGGCYQPPGLSLRVSASGTDAQGLWADLRADVRGYEQEEQENVAPFVILDEVLGGVERTMGETVELRVTVWDSDSDVVQARVQVDDRWIELSGPPFVTSWTPTAPGSYSIQAQATDGEGASSTSRRRAVLIQDPAFETRPVGRLGWQSVYTGEWTGVNMDSLARPVVVAMFRDPIDFRDVPELRRSGSRIDVRANFRTGEDRRSVIVLAAEAGTHRLRDGSRLYAGTVAPPAGRWVRVPFREPGGRTPGVFVSAIGAAEGDAPPRVRRVGADGFDVWSDAGHLVDFFAVEPALLPSDVNAFRLETGVVGIAAGGSDIDVLQWFDTRPALHVASLQDAEEAEPPLVRISQETLSFQMTVDNANQLSASERSVAYLLSGRLASNSPAAAMLGTTLTPVPEPAPAPTLEFRAVVAPNPVRGAAQVLLTLIEGAVVQATLLDVLGREVARFADGYQEAGQASYSVPRGLPSGTYIVRLRVGDAVQTKPFTVTR